MVEERIGVRLWLVGLDTVNNSELVISLGKSKSP